MIIKGKLPQNGCLSPERLLLAAGGKGKRLLSGLYRCWLAPQPAFRISLRAFHREPPHYGYGNLSPPCSTRSYSRTHILTPSLVRIFSTPLLRTIVRQSPQSAPLNMFVLSYVYTHAIPGAHLFHAPPSHPIVRQSPQSAPLTCSYSRTHILAPSPVRIFSHVSPFAPHRTAVPQSAPFNLCILSYVYTHASLVPLFPRILLPPSYGNTPIRPA